MNYDILKDCTLCPRNCHIDRTNGQVGYCRATDKLMVARAALHMWEEPCISGDSGSGTVFFSGCSLGCVYCQNTEISKGLVGKTITVERLSDIFLELQSKGAKNINLVTASHFVPQIIEAIAISKNKGLVLPIVYNCSGYEKKESLKMLEGYIDVYLPDFKYKSGELSKKYSNCEDYFQYAKEAVNEMHRQVGKPIFNEDGIMIKGVLVRHLLLPGNVDDSKEIIKYIYETYKDSIYISIMNQYTPMPQIAKYEELNRKVKEDEYDEVIDYAISLGIVNGFIQDGDTAEESFIPDFNNEGV